VTAIDTNSQAAMKYNAWLLSQHLKGQTRSNSWSDDFSFDDYRTSDVNRSLLGESNRFFYDNLKKSYAELLYCYELLPQRAQVLKYLSIPPAPFNNGVEFVSDVSEDHSWTFLSTLQEVPAVLLIVSAASARCRKCLSRLRSCWSYRKTFNPSQVVPLLNFIHRLICSSGSTSTTCAQPAAANASRRAEAFLIFKIFN
jgi:hypothetical protein